MQLPLRVWVCASAQCILCSWRCRRAFQGRCWSRRVGRKRRDVSRALPRGAFARIRIPYSHMIESRPSTSPDLTEAGYSIRSCPPSARRQNATKYARIALIALIHSDSPPGDRPLSGDFEQRRLPIRRSQPRFALGGKGRSPRRPRTPSTRIPSLLRSLRFPRLRDGHSSSAFGFVYYDSL